MYLKPINRQGKKRRKLRTVPALSCDGGSFGYPSSEKVELPKATKALIEKKKDAA